MRVIVKYHEDVEQSLREALLVLARRSPNGHLIARFAVELIREGLSKTAGRPPGVVIDHTREPPPHWWQFTRGFWVGFVVRDRGHLWWRRRDITIYAVRERLPDPAA